MVTFNGINHQSTPTLTMGRQYNLTYFAKPNTYRVINNFGNEEEIAAQYFSPNYCIGEDDTPRY